MPSTRIDPVHFPSQKDSSTKNSPVHLLTVCLDKLKYTGAQNSEETLYKNYTAQKLPWFVKFMSTCVAFDFSLVVMTSCCPVVTVEGRSTSQHNELETNRTNTKIRIIR